MVNRENSDEDFKARGVSIRSWDNSNNEKVLKDENANPFGDVDESDRRGAFTCH
jgi:hypothetical protein